MARTYNVDATTIGRLQPRGASQLPDRAALNARRVWHEDAGTHRLLSTQISLADQVCEFVRHAVADHAAQFVARLLSLLRIALRHASSLSD